MGNAITNFFYYHRNTAGVLVVIYAATTKMNFWRFSLWVTIGFFIRCYLLALATQYGFHLII